MDLPTVGEDERRATDDNRFWLAIRRSAARALASRRVFRFLIASTFVLAVASGTLAWLLDRESFPTVGDGIWWAVVTLTTVGYGDIVPEQGWGRVLGSFVMVVGITFISYLTATVTSYLVTVEQERRAPAPQADVAPVLARIDERLSAIEAHLGIDPSAAADGPAEHTG